MPSRRLPFLILFLSLLLQAFSALAITRSGSYGGMQGVGGLETITTVSATGNTAATILNDYFGNVLGAVTNSTVAWNSSRVNLYAPVEGYVPPRLSLSAPTYASLALRNINRNFLREVIHAPSFACCPAPSHYN